MHPSVWREFWVIVAIAAGGVLLGLILGRPFLGAAAGFILYIGANLRQLHRLHRWLLNRRRGEEVPEAEGLWGDVFKEIRKLVRQTGQREDRLTGMIERFQSAAAVMPDAVVIMAQQGEIEWANSAARRLLGIHFPRDAGMRLSNLLRDPDFTRYYQGGDYSEPFEMPSPSHLDITLQVLVVPFGASQKLILGRDVTRIVQLEQMRRTFVANASHELRTPLTVLSGYLETLRGMEAELPEDLRKHFATMHEQAIRMQRLVNDLLTLSRLETAPRSRDEPVDVPALLAGLMEQAELLSAGNHALTLDAQPDLSLLGSRDELHSAFSNLVNNAVRYTPRGGTVRLRWFADREGAKFSVEDTGEGIASEHIPHLTERFYRVDTARSRASGGTGLGLSIVKHVLLRHDAELRIESELGRGSSFTCVFPRGRVVRTEIRTRATPA